MRTRRFVSNSHVPVEVYVVHPPPSTWLTLACCPATRAIVGLHASHAQPSRVDVSRAIGVATHDKPLTGADGRLGWPLPDATDVLTTDHGACVQSGRLNTLAPRGAKSKH